MKEVSKLLKRLNSSTDPFEAKIDNTFVYVKSFGGRWTNKVLINEYVCLNMAKALDIPIPEGGICNITENTDIKAVEDDIDYGEDIKGIGFYSEKIYNVAPSIKAYTVFSNIINIEDINSIILFDHLIYNIDRHKGNLLLHYGNTIEGYRMYLIDHSHVFNLRHNWDVAGLQKLMDKDDYKDKNILNDNYKDLYRYFFDIGAIKRDLLEKAAEKFKNTITKEFLDGIINNVPKVWYLKIEDLNKLRDYIMYRLSHIDFIIEMILSYPYSLGGV